MINDHPVCLNRHRGVTELYLPYHYRNLCFPVDWIDITQTYYSNQASLALLNNSKYQVRFIRDYLSVEKIKLF